MRPRLLDLFCGAGGAAMGYHRAGFDVTGVDRAPQKRFPFRFIQGDALAYLREHGHEYDAIVASPPCQAYSQATPLHHREVLPRLIAPTRDLLMELGKPYVIENVENARAELRDPVMLCGTMFGMPVWRHRYFECGGFALTVTGKCSHDAPPVTIHSGSHTRKLRGNTGVVAMREAMGIDWMTGKELYEAIPPAYTEFVGRALMDEVLKRRSGGTEPRLCPYCDADLSVNGVRVETQVNAEHRLVWDGEAWRIDLGEPFQNDTDYFCLECESDLGMYILKDDRTGVALLNR
jgi:DNA (cytosine-5)-methyltransferase 1